MQKIKINVYTVKYNKKKRKFREDKDEMPISISPKNKYASSLIEMISFKSLIS